MLQNSMAKAGVIARAVLPDGRGTDGFVRFETSFTYQPNTEIGDNPMVAM